jgi:anti-anti-sigma factor
MELKVTSSDQDLLGVQIAGRMLEADLEPESDPIRPLLDERGYARKVLLDLADCDFVSSSGLALLLVWHKRFSEAGGVLIIHSIPNQVMEVFKILRMELVLNLAEDKTAALQWVRGEVA